MDMTETNLPWEGETTPLATATMSAVVPDAVPDVRAQLLPAGDALADILAEQARIDAVYEDEPQAAMGELGKTALEERAEIPSLAALHYRRRVIARALAPLAALFEGGQTPPAEAKRKQHRAMIATQIASEQGITGDKVEAKLERLANADARHLAFCERLEALRVDFFLGRVALLEVNEEIRDREEALRARTAEVRAGLTGAGQV